MLTLGAALAGCGAKPPPEYHDGTAVAQQAESTPPPVASDPATPQAPAGSTVAPTPTRSATGSSPTPASSGRPAASTPTPTPTKARAGGWKYVFPVSGRNVSYHPTHSGYPATDIFANCGQPVVAVTDGTVLEVSRVDRYRKGAPAGPLNGGLSVSLLGADGVRYYGSHLTVVDTGIEAGVRVRAGQRLGTVGRTGNANNVCHLHFGISPACARTGDWNVRRGVVWPASFLDSWREKGSRSP
ncbi:MAG TPA: peptidoglycan DD-metalloendopeptidase family protein, partial [Catenuloplanes sp.]